MTTNAALPKIWASGFDSSLVAGLYHETTDRDLATQYLFCGANMLSFMHGYHNSSQEEIISERDINPGMPVWHISIVPNVGQSKLYPASTTSILRKVSVGTYSYFSRDLAKIKTGVCNGVKLLDMYVGVNHSIRHFISNFQSNKGLILRFLNDAKLWRDCITEGAKYDDSMPDEVMSRDGVHYNPFLIPRGVGLGVLTVGDVAWNFLNRVAHAVCDYSIHETLDMGVKGFNSLHFVSNQVYNQIEDPILKHRAAAFRMLLDYNHSALSMESASNPHRYVIPINFLRELGIYPIA